MGLAIRELNVSLRDYLLSHLRAGLKPMIEYCIAFVNYRKTFSNYITVLMHRLRNKYPVESVLRNGEFKVLRNFSDIKALLLPLDSKTGYSINYDQVNEITTIFLSSGRTGKKNKLILHGGRFDGDIWNIFCNDIYGRVPVKGRTVVDIGASIGDSAIYFVLSGANRVVAFEPFPRSYKLAKINIESNNFSDKVTLKMAGCAANIGSIIIDPDYKSNKESQLSPFASGVKIPLLTLEQILDENNVEYGSILKIDCEGSEYGIILSTPAEILRRFEYIQIEYHSGYKNLKDKLERSGFRVCVDSPVAVGYFNMLKQLQHKKISRVSPHFGYLGYIYAILK
jgi:FkbM family methyltransferase